MYFSTNFSKKKGMNVGFQNQELFYLYFALFCFVFNKVDKY